MSDTANMRQDYHRPTEGIDLAKDSPYPDQSAKHADWAMSHFVKANGHEDPSLKAVEVELAKTLATLSLRDKLDELVETIKVCTSQVLDAQRHLYSKGEQLHRDAQELKHLRVVREEAA